LKNRRKRHPHESRRHCALTEQEKMLLVVLQVLAVDANQLSLTLQLPVERAEPLGKQLTRRFLRVLDRLTQGWRSPRR